MILSISGCAVWRHNKGGTYTVLGESSDIVYYVAHSDGRMWWRPRVEFFDGRFTPVEDATPLHPEQMGFERG